jgi:outer membrane protein OmpA-like peptidoglycan-associated protein
MDGDGIDNDADACPTKPGKRTTDPATNGCPAAVLAFPSLTFRSGSTNVADLAPGALDQILELLKAHPEAKKVTFEGHADGTEAHAPELSANRAATIVKWLTAKGIAADRLTFKGSGATKPVDRNTDEEGRARNRRVEIHVEW